MILQWGSGIFALLAAPLWLKSAKIKTPSSFPIHVVKPDGFGRPMGDPHGATYMGQGHSPSLNELGEALRCQSKWGAAAAVFAAVSAICQAFAMALDAVK